MNFRVRVRIKEGWEEAGRVGTLLAEVEVVQTWGVVLWEDEEDPDCHKRSGLEVIPIDGVFVFPSESSS